MSAWLAARRFNQDTMAEAIAQPQSANTDSACPRRTAPASGIKAQAPCKRTKRWCTRQELNLRPPV